MSILLRACLCLLAGVFVLAANVAFAADDVRFDAARVVEYLNQLNAFSARFSQTRYDETGVEIEQSNGECQVHRPGRFRWTYLEPYAQTIVSNGRQLWIYDVDLEQVTRNEVEAIGTDSPAALLGQDIDVESHFEIRAVRHEESWSWFDLIPKSEQRDFSVVELGFNGGEIEAMRLRDNLGQATLIRFSDLDRTAVIDQAEFEFQIPVGVDVLEGGVP